MLALWIVPNPPVPRKFVYVSLRTCQHEADWNYENLLIAGLLRRACRAISIGFPGFITPMPNWRNAIALGALQPLRKAHRHKSARIRILSFSPFLDHRREAEAVHTKLFLQPGFAYGLCIRKAGGWKGAIPFFQARSHAGNRRVVGTIVDNGSGTEKRDDGAAPQVLQIIRHGYPPSLSARGQAGRAYRLPLCASSSAWATLIPVFFPAPSSTPRARR